MGRRPRKTLPSARELLAHRPDDRDRINRHFQSEKAKQKHYHNLREGVKPLAPLQPQDQVRILPLQRSRSSMQVDTSNSRKAARVSPVIHRGVHPQRSQVQEEPPTPTPVAPETWSKRGDTLRMTTVPHFRQLVMESSPPQEQPGRADGSTDPQVFPNSPRRTRYESTVRKPDRLDLLIVSCC